MTKVTSVPISIELFADDLFALASELAVLDMFPSWVGFDSAFNREMLVEAIASRRLSQEGLLAAAFFGHMPISSSPQRLTTHASRYFKAARVGQNPTPKIKVEVFTKQAYQMTRREMKALLATLDDMARAKGFCDFADVFYCDGYPAGVKAPGHGSIRYRKWLGPRFMWEIKERVALCPHPDLEIGVHNLWMLVLVRAEDSVVGRAFRPSWLRTGDGDEYSLNHTAHLALEAPNDAPLFTVPGTVQTQLAKLASERFPGVRYEFHASPTIGDIRAIVNGRVS